MYITNNKVLIKHNLFTDGVSVVDVSEFGGGDFLGPIFLDQLHCSGEETNLSSCDYSTVHMCRHEQDIGIICHRKTINIIQM